MDHLPDLAQILVETEEHLREALIPVVAALTPDPRVQIYLAYAGADAIVKDWLARSKGRAMHMLIERSDEREKASAS